jgi:hypothetical protein
MQQAIQTRLLRGKNACNRDPMEVLPNYSSTTAIFAVDST